MMRLVRAIWKLLVGVKDALVLLLMLIFFGGLYAALAAGPPPVKDGVLNLALNGSLVEQASKPSATALLSGQGERVDVRRRRFQAFPPERRCRHA